MVRNTFVVFFDCEPKARQIGWMSILLMIIFHFDQTAQNSSEIAWMLSQMIWSTFNH